MKVSISNEVFEVTDEQLEKIKKIVVKAKKKFEPIQIHNGCFVVSVGSTGRTITILTGDDYPSHGCYQLPNTAREFIAALQSAIDFIEENKT